MATDLTHQPTPKTVDLTGLPEPVVHQVMQLVKEARRKQAEESPVPAPGERPPLLGRFAHLGLSFPKEELDEAQREAWAGFPREFLGGEVGRHPG